MGGHLERRLFLIGADIEHRAADAHEPEQHQEPVHRACPFDIGRVPYGPAQLAKQRQAQRIYGSPVPRPRAPSLEPTPTSPTCGSHARLGTRAGWLGDLRLAPVVLAPGRWPAHEFCPRLSTGLAYWHDAVGTSERWRGGHARCRRPRGGRRRLRAHESAVGGRRPPDGRDKRRHAVADRDVGPGPSVAIVDFDRPRRRLTRRSSSLPTTAGASEGDSGQPAP